LKAHQNIFLICVCILATFCSNWLQAAIRLTAPMQIWPPTITSNRVGLRSLPVVGATEKNALLVWTEPKDLFGGPTNVMAVSISQDGQMLQPFGLVIGNEGFAASRPEIYPAGDEFYVLFQLVPI
jgi:hypothetical protein